MRGSDFTFDYVESLNYIFHKIDMKRSGSYIDSPKWIKNKKATINPKNKDDDKCFQYVKPFINQYDWSEIYFPSHVGDWKKSELNNKSIALNVLYVPEGEKTIRHTYKSKYYLTCANQVILLMITNGEKGHYLTVRSLSALLKRRTSKHNGDSYCLNCFHSYRTKEALENHMKVCEDKDYCYIEMPEKSALFKYHHGVKSMRAPFVMYADLESLLEKMNTCTNDPNKSSTTQINKHEMYGCSFTTHC